MYDNIYVLVRYDTLIFDNTLYAITYMCTEELQGK